MVRILYALASLGLVVGMVFGFLGALHPAFDTFAHFRWHFALGLIALTLTGLALKIRRAPFVLLCFALLGVWGSDAGNRIDTGFNVAAAIGKGVANDVDGTRIRLLHYNLWYENPLMDEVLAMITTTDADILSFSETSSAWTQKLETLIIRYPHRFRCPEWNTLGGTMILSKYPLHHDADYCHDYAALGMTTVEVGNRKFEIGTVHMRWPWPASGPSQLVALEPKLKTIEENAIIVGDFNAATWSHAVQHFASLSGMTVQRGFGGTWISKPFPTALAPMFGLPIDNVMTKGNVHVRNVKTLPAIGSDHLPVLVELLLN